MSHSGDNGSAPRELSVRAAVGAILLICVALIFAQYLRGHGTQLIEPRAMDVAQVARHLARGEGFTTSLLRPLSLAHVRSVSHHPDLNYAPLGPLWISLFFRLLKPTGAAAMWAGGVAFLLTLPLTYLLGLRLFGQKAALLATVLLALSQIIISQTARGTHFGLALLLVTGAFLLLHLYCSRPGPDLRLAVALGAAVALCFLTEYAYAVLLLPAVGAVYWVHRGRSTAAAVACVLAFLVLVSPWCVRNMSLVKWHPVGLAGGDALSGTEEYSGQTIYRQFTTDLPQPLVYLAGHPGQALRKVWGPSVGFYTALAGLAGWFLTAFFIASLLAPADDQAMHIFRRAYYVALALTAFTLLWGATLTRFLLPLCVPATVIAGGYFLALVERQCLALDALPQRTRFRALAIGLLVLVGVFPLLPDMVRPGNRSDPDAEPKGWVQICRPLRAAGQTPLYTDRPWTVAWYGDVDAIWLPHVTPTGGPGNLLKLEDSIGLVRSLLLSPAVVGEAPEEQLNVWQTVYRNAAQGSQDTLMGFTPDQALGPGRDWFLFGRLPLTQKDQQAAPPAANTQPAAPK